MLPAGGVAGCLCRRWDKRLALGRNDCRHHTRALIQLLTSQPGALP
jgi:hypothetical protein